MAKILCSIQQGTVDAGRIPALEAALHRQYATHFGGARPLVIWAEVPHGQAYTEGRLAEGAWLMVEVPDGTDQARREKAMLEMAAEWARIAGMAVEKMMVTLCDSTLFAEYLEANRSRLGSLHRAWYTLKVIAWIVRSRRRHGYAAIGVNYY
jgi:hypothetical protein